MFNRIGLSLQNSIRSIENKFGACWWNWILIVKKNVSLLQEHDVHLFVCVCVYAMHHKNVNNNDYDVCYILS